MYTHRIQYQELLSNGYLAQKTFRTTADAVKIHVNKLSKNKKVTNLFVVEL